MFATRRTTTTLAQATRHLEITGSPCTDVGRCQCAARALEWMWSCRDEEEHGACSAGSHSVRAAGAGASCPDSSHLHDCAHRTEASLSICSGQCRPDAASRGCIRHCLSRRDAHQPPRSPQRTQRRRDQLGPSWRTVWHHDHDRRVPQSPNVPMFPDDDCSVLNIRAFSHQSFGMTRFLSTLRVRRPLRMRSLFWLFLHGSPSLGHKAHRHQRHQC